MKYQYRDRVTSGVFNFIENENNIYQNVYIEKGEDLLTIAWNIGKDQTVKIDGLEYKFPEQTIVPLVNNNVFEFSKPEDIIGWQFNREFYCIIDHEKEVSCSGFIFYGSHGNIFIELDKKEQRKIEMLSNVIVDEFQEADEIQGEMMRMLLKRLIILITRKGKKQHFEQTDIEDPEVDIVREYNLLVEKNYKKIHQVQEYASMLYKSPKTLSNLFSKYNSKSPLQVIQARVLLEAKRLLQYTDMTSKEIAYDLGFEDPGNFSRFFKKQTKITPTEFKELKN